MARPRLNRIGAGTDEIMLEVIGRSYGPGGGLNKALTSPSHSATSTRSCGNRPRLLEREFAPHAQEWEAERWFPDEVFGKLAGQGLLGLKYPGWAARARLPARGGVGRGARADRLGRYGRRDRGAHQSPRRRSGSSAPMSRSSATSCPRSAARRSARSRSPSPMRARTLPRCARGGAGRRRVDGERREDLHHERGARPLHRHSRQDRPTRAVTTGSRSSSSTRRGRELRQAREARLARLGHRHDHLRRTCSCPRRTCSASRTRVSS